MIDPNWAKWIFASICKYFEDNKGTLNLFIEGRDYDSVAEADKKVELRVDGPNIVEQSRGYFRFDVEINTICTIIRDDSDTYKIQRLTSFVSSLFKDINVFRYGGEPQDDESFVGCLILKQDSSEKVEISYFGQVEPRTRVMQSAIEGHYKMTLQT